MVELRRWFIDDRGSEFLEGAVGVDTVVLDDGEQEFNWEIGKVVFGRRALHTG